MNDLPAIVRPAEDLAVLAEIINAAHEATEAAMRSGLEKAKEAGDALRQAKAAVKHGQWLPWLEKNVRCSQRTAYNYMDVSKHWDKLASLANLADAYQVLSSANESPEKSAPHVSYNSGENEWYTPPEYLDAARELLGGIDLDPASSDAAQENVRAAEYYTADDDGLQHDWRGRVWLNPPYAAEPVSQFVHKLLDHYATGEVTAAILLVNNATETKWFQRAMRECAVICFPDGRIHFLDKDGTEGQPLQGQALLYFGDDGKQFIETHKRFGECWSRGWRTDS
jgi:ParB family chromosome partitioning protein